MSLLLVISVVAGACSGLTVPTGELGGRSDGLANPSTDTTSSTEATPTTTTPAPIFDQGPEELIEGSVNRFFAALKEGDILGAYVLMAPQHRDQCSLEEAEAIGAEPSDGNDVLEVIDYSEVPGGAIITVRDRVDGAEIPGVGMVLFGGDWYVDVPLCIVLEAYLANENGLAAKSNLRNALTT